MTFFAKALQRYGAAGLVAAAALFYTIAYVPAVFFAGINSDEVQVSVFYRDIFQLGHSPSGWVCGGATNLFPDWSFCFLLTYFLHDGLVAEAAMLAVFFIAWLSLLLTAYLLCGGKRPEIFFPFVVLLSVLFGRSDLSHVGAMLNVLVCLNLTFLLRRKSLAVGWVALVIFVFLGASSDALFVVMFVGPVMVALATEILIHQSTGPMPRFLLTLIPGSALAGYLSAPFLFPVPSVRASFTELRPDTILDSVSGVWKECSLSQHPWVVLLFVFQALVFITGGVAVICLRDQLKKGSPILVPLLAYTVALVVINWTALLLTVGWTGPASIRYLFFTLAWPPLAAAGFVSEIFNRFSWPSRLLAIGVALYTLDVAVHPPPKSPQYLAALQRIPDLQALMTREHLQAGLAQYWYASLTTYLSGETVPLRAVDGGGTMRHWFSNLQWYEGVATDSPLPKFRLILMPALDPQALRARFGPPDRVAIISGHEEVWIYSEANAITYNRVFGDLGNGRLFPTADQADFAAAALPSQTGRLQGLARIARSGRDSSGCVTFGPYLHAKPGRYRVDYAYTYLRAPALDKLVTFDCVLRFAEEDYLDRFPLAYLDAKPKVLSRQIIVPPHPEDATLELRLHYAGSGDIEVDSLHLTYLGS